MGKDCGDEIQTGHACAEEMEYRLNMGCKATVLTEHWFYICKDGYCLNKCSRDEVQIGHGMWRWSADWICAVEISTTNV